MSAQAVRPPWVVHDKRTFSKGFLENATLEYSDTNEDLSASLACLDVRSGQIVVGVTASADLLLLALRHDPAFVAGFDVNPAQNAFAELKRAAIRSLSYDEYLQLLGYRPSHGRLRLLATALEVGPQDIRPFWNRPDMIQTVESGLWQSGTATRKDLALWEAALRQLEAHLGPHELQVALGLEGSDDQRTRIRTRIARLDPKYAEPAIRNNNHFKFDAFRYPQGMANQPAVARYAAAFLPESSVTAPIGREDFEQVRDRLHRVSFQTLSIHEALEQMPPNAFDRAYLSNITEYLTLEQERTLVENLLKSGKTGAIVVLLYLALTPTQQRDLLDHSTWSERGLARFLHASSWKLRAQHLRNASKTPAYSITLRLGRAMQKLTRGSAQQLLDQTRSGLRALQQRLSNEGLRQAQHAAQRAVESSQHAWNEAQSRWNESKQLASRDFVLVENQARDAALFSDLYANLRATHAAKSFYGFDYAILQKVVRNGATYDVPTSD